MEKRHATRRSKRRIRSADTDFGIYYPPSIISSSQQITSSIQTRSKSRRLVTEFNFHLPDECWESIFKFIIRDDKNYIYLDSISMVSKQFLSITDRLRISLKYFISLFSTRYFERFTNLVSLNLSCFGVGGDINKHLEEISRFPLKLTSLNISNKPIPVDGLRALSKNTTTLTSLTCSYSTSIETVMFLIADCFLLLEELDLSYPIIEPKENYESLLNGVKTLSSKLFKLRKVNLNSHKYINDQSLFHLFKNWKFLEEAIILNCFKITSAGVASALSERPTLRSLSFNKQIGLGRDNATFFALFNNGPSLSEISLSIWENRVENSNPLTDVPVIPQIKSLCLAHNTLSDERIKIFVSLFPNLQLLNLSYGCKISEEGICQVLKRCHKIIHLDLTGCSQLKLLGLNFEVPKLEVLNLSYTKVDDKTLFVISKHCRGLLQLLLVFCNDVTEKGVKDVIKNCTQLREIDLRGCRYVDVNVVASMVISRPSWREITTPSSFKSFPGLRKVFFHQGCPFAKCLKILW